VPDFGMICSAKLSSTRFAVAARSMATMIAQEQPIEGAFVLRSFLNQVERSVALKAAISLSGQAQTMWEQSKYAAAVSPTHNVNSQEQYKSVKVTLDDGRTATCEHFSNYGDGHRLTYYRGEIPAPGVPDIVERLSALTSVKNEVASSRLRPGPHQKPPDVPFKWRLTLNHYPQAADLSMRKGFPWHRDLIANGASTMILNLGAPGWLEFGEEPPRDDGPTDGMIYSSDHKVAVGDSIEALERVTLNDGDLLLLTGRARWEYVHRAVAVRGGGERVTLVYGVW